MIVKTITGLMLIAAALALGLGITSYWRGVPEGAIWVGYAETQPRWQAAMVRGTLHVVYTVPIVATGPNRPAPVSKAEHRMGPFYWRRMQIGNAIGSGVGVPFWSISVVLMLWPAGVMIRGPIRRHRRRRRGECIRCGYNLAGLTQPRCPECGEGFLLEIKPGMEDGCDRSPRPMKGMVPA